MPHARYVTRWHANTGRRYHRNANPASLRAVQSETSRPQPSERFRRYCANGGDMNSPGNTTSQNIIGARAAIST